MSTINGTKNPKPGVKAKSVLGTTFKSEPGKEAEHFVEWTPTHVVPDGVLTANVNVSMGARIGLADYSDVRCGASLTIPAIATKVEIESAFLFAKSWCEQKVQAMVTEIKEENP